MAVERQPAGFYRLFPDEQKNPLNGDHLVTMILQT